MFGCRSTDLQTPLQVHVISDVSTHHAQVTTHYTPYTTYYPYHRGYPL
jgi:hypothetical protein